MMMEAARANNNLVLEVPCLSFPEERLGVLHFSAGRAAHPGVVNSLSTARAARA